MQDNYFPRFNYVPAFTLTIAAQTPLPADIIIDYLAFCNTDTSDRTVTVTDGRGKTLLAAVTVAAKSLITVPLPEGGLLFTGGIQISASADAKVDCWIRKRP